MQISHSHAGYMDGVFGEPVKFLNLIQKCKDVYDAAEHGKIDYLACTGISGLIVAAPLSISLGIPIVVVRKPKVYSHSGFLCEGLPIAYENGRAATDAIFRYIIVDDFICRGETLARVIKTLKEAHGECGQYGYCDGALLWRNHDDANPFGAPAYLPFDAENYKWDRVGTRYQEMTETSLFKDNVDK